MKKARKVTPLDEALEKTKVVFTKENMKQLAKNVKEIADKIKTTVKEKEIKEKVKGILESKKSKELGAKLERVKNKYNEKIKRSSEVLNELEELITSLAREKASCLTTLEEGVKFFDSLEIKNKVVLKGIEDMPNKNSKLEGIRVEEKQESNKLVITKEKVKKITEKIEEYELGIEENEKMIALIEEKIGEIKKLISILKATKLKLKQELENLITKLKKTTFISKLVKSFKTKILRKNKFSIEEEEEIGEMVETATKLSKLIEKNIF